jgi:hypothetical protein
VPLTGIAFTLTGTAANLANYALVSLPPVYVNCGATLAVGANCKINYQFKPLTSQAAGAKFVTLSVTDSAGTQTAALNGTAQ